FTCSPGGFRMTGGFSTTAAPPDHLSVAFCSMRWTSACSVGIATGRLPGSTPLSGACAAATKSGGLRLPPPPPPPPPFPPRVHPLEWGMRGGHQERRFAPLLTGRRPLRLSTGATVSLGADGQYAPDGPDNSRDEQADGHQGQFAYGRGL